MVGVIDGFRWATLGGASTIYLPGFLLSTILVAVLFSQWHLVLSENRTYFRRCYLVGIEIVSDIVLRVEDLGKNISSAISSQTQLCGMRSLVLPNLSNINFWQNLQLIV
ncbi:MAG: hypothetical protein N4J56_001112 [Chroococcidiopsis sp. SAG 2025]|nr:hypothetical protein [Chroococcidiopsis sp. SAG 2025]